MFVQVFDVASNDAAPDAALYADKNATFTTPLP
jgi:hypothetical protein